MPSAVAAPNTGVFSFFIKFGFFFSSILQQSFTGYLPFLYFQHIGGLLSPLLSCFYL